MIDISSFNSLMRDAWMEYEKAPAEEYRAYMDGVTDILALVADEELVASAKPAKKEPKPEIKTASVCKVFFEPYTGNVFSSTIDEIRKAEANVMAEIQKSGYATFNEYLLELGLNTCTFGRMFGFDTDHPLKIDFVESDEDDRLVLQPSYYPIPYEQLTMVQLGVIKSNGKTVKD